MNEPHIDELMTKADSKYSLVIVTAKRAREITEENPELLENAVANPVSIALKEIHEGKIVWQTACQYAEQEEDND